MVLSILEDTRLQGAGTQGKVQGMGGVTLELEVLTARGYSRTSYSDGMTKLDQEDQMCIRDRRTPVWATPPTMTS